MEILTRKQAISRGLHKYYTGWPCKRGHNSLRYTNTGGCIGCKTVYNRGVKAPQVTDKKIHLDLWLSAENAAAVTAYVYKLELADILSSKNAP